MTNRRRSFTKSVTPDIIDQMEGHELLKYLSGSRSPTTSRSLDEKVNAKLLELPIVPIKKVLTKIGGVPK
jgi:hypothetical protein